MDLVDALRGEGHAAVISGAGPSVVVLTTRARAGGVLVPANRAGWTRLEPGHPLDGGGGGSDLNRAEPGPDGTRRLSAVLL